MPQADKDKEKKLDPDGVLRRMLKTPPEAKKKKWG
jgi:hypothetical protein